MPTQVIPLEGIDKAGVIMDSPAAKLPPGAWTNARNVRFDDGAIRRMKGEEDVFPGLSFSNIKHIGYWENPNVRCYVVIERESDGDHAYIVTLGGDGQFTAEDKTRVADNTGDTVPFSFSEGWESIQYNGGYSIIINNGIEAPHHISVQLGGSSSLTDIPDFAALPGWDSYLGTRTYWSVSAEILIPFGSLLVAGALTERSLPQLPFISGITVNATDEATITFDAAHGLSLDDQFVIEGDSTYTWTWTKLGDGTLLNPDEDDDYEIPSPYNQVYTVTAITAMTATVMTSVDFAAGTAETDLVLDNQANTDTDTPEEYTAGLVPPFSPGINILSLWTLDDSAGGAPDMQIVRDLNGVVRTSSVAPPGSIPNNWNPFALGANTADELNLADAGKITSVRELRGNLFVYTSDSITQLRVSNQGLTAVPITKEYGALTHTGVFSWRGSHIVVGSDDIYTFQGNPGDIKSIVDGRVRDYFFTQLDITTFRNMQFTRNQLHDEIWLCYPTFTSEGETLNEALVWDYTDNTWSIRDLPNVTSVTKGPIQGQGNKAFVLDLTPYNDGTFIYSLTITNANGQTTTQGSSIIVTDGGEELADAILLDIDGQSGFSARAENNEILYNDSRLGRNPWTLSLTVDTDTITPVYRDVDPTNTERPWPLNILNESENFVLMSTTDGILAAELGYNTADQPAFFEKYNFHLTPTKDTEVLSAVYLLTEGTGVFDVFITPIETAGQGRAIDLASGTGYEFDLTDDYKIDTRVTSRLVGLRFVEKVPTAQQPTEWAVAGIDLEVGKRGTR